MIDFASYEPVEEVTTARDPVTAKLQLRPLLQRVLHVVALKGKQQK